MDDEELVPAGEAQGEGLGQIGEVAPGLVGDMFYRPNQYLPFFRLYTGRPGRPPLRPFNHFLIIVADDRRDAPLLEEAADCIRERPIPGHIPGADDPVGPAGFRIGDRCFECRQVAVDIGNERDQHRNKIVLPAFRTSKSCF